MKMSWHRPLVWVLVGLAFALFGTELFLRAQVPVSTLGIRISLWPMDVVDLGFLFYAALGGLIALRKPDNRVGWIFLAIGLSAEITGLTGAYVTFMKLVRPGAPMISAWILWLPSMMWTVCYGIPLLLLFYFPNGRLLSNRWRPAIWVLALALFCWLVIFGDDVQAGAHHFLLPSLLNLLGLNGLGDPLLLVYLASHISAALAAIGAIVVRMIRSRGDERLQLKWFAYAGVIAVLINLVMNLFFDYFARLDPNATYPAGLFWGIPQTLSLIILPAAAAVAILRYQLYEIDIIIRKTLVYATLTAILVIVYAGTIIILETALAPLTGKQHSDAAIVLSTLTIATIFTPLRRRIQGWIDRRFFRKRYDADQVLVRFSSTARNEVDLERILERLLGVVGETMQPEEVSLWIRRVPR